MYTNDQILEHAKQLGRMMAETDAVEFFKRAEAQIHENQTVREKMASLKSLQKQAVNFEQYGKEKALQMTEEKIAKVEAELDDMPLVDQFKEAQGEVNSLLQMVSHAISQTVTDEIIVSTGGDVPKGETGAQIANSAPGCGN